MSRHVSDVVSPHQFHQSVSQMVSFIFVAGWIFYIFIELTYASFCRQAFLLLLRYLYHVVLGHTVYSVVIQDEYYCLVYLYAVTLLCDRVSAAVTSEDWPQISCHSQALVIWSQWKCVLDWSTNRRDLAQGDHGKWARWWEVACHLEGSERRGHVTTDVNNRCSPSLHRLFAKNMLIAFCYTELRCKYIYISSVFS